MKDIIRMNQLAGVITEGQARKMMEVLEEAPLDFDLADKIASGEYQRPGPPALDPTTSKKIEIINKFTSKPFGYEDTIDLFNNLGPITPKELQSIENKLNNIDFEIENYAMSLVNLVIYSKNYKDEGVALTWDGDEWSQ